MRRRSRSTTIYNATPGPRRTLFLSAPSQSARPDIAPPPHTLSFPRRAAAIVPVFVTGFKPSGPAMSLHTSRAPPFYFLNSQRSQVRHAHASTLADRPHAEEQRVRTRRQDVRLWPRKQLKMIATIRGIPVVCLLHPSDRWLLRSISLSYWRGSGRAIGHCFVCQHTAAPLVALCRSLPPLSSLPPRCRRKAQPRRGRSARAQTRARAAADHSVRRCAPPCSR